MVDVILNTEAIQRVSRIGHFYLLPSIYIRYVGRVLAPKDTYTLTSGNEDYVALHSKKRCSGFVREFQVEGLSCTPWVGST